MKLKVISFTFVILTVIAGYIFFPNLSAYFLLKQFTLANELPVIYEIPVQKQLVQQSENLSEKISTKWFDFSTPWQLADTETYHEITGYYFINNSSIMVNERSSALKMQNVLFSENGKLEDYSDYIIESNNLTSEYDIENLILNTTPTKVNFFSPNEEITITLNILMVKSVSTLGDKIYSFETNNLKGFQFTKLDSPQNVRIHIFDNQDRCFEFVFDGIAIDIVDSILSSIKLIDNTSETTSPKKTSIDSE